MTRIVKGWTEERVEDTPVAPHRYTFEGSPDELDYGVLIRDGKAGATARWRESLAYKAGEVVMVAAGEVASRARILDVFPDFNDYMGEFRPKYRVQRETKAGTWSKVWEYTWPGFIQRGYQRAGLAPDLDAADERAKAAKAKMEARDA